MFAGVPFAKVRKAKERPETYIVVTFGLSHKVESPRIDVATEPYPGRWTHHVLIASEEEIDEELLGWVKEAEAFAVRKIMFNWGRGIFKNPPPQLKRPCP